MGKRDGGRKDWDDRPDDLRICSYLPIDTCLITFFKPVENWYIPRCDKL